MPSSGSDSGSASPRLSVGAGGAGAEGGGGEISTRELLPPPLLLLLAPLSRLGSPATTKTKTRRMPWALRPARGAPRRGRRSGSKEREKKAGKAAGSVDADDDVVVSVAADAADWASPPRQERRRCHCRQLLARISSIADSCRRDSSRHALSLSGECVGEGREKSTNNENKEKSAMAPKQKKGPPFRP